MSFYRLVKRIPNYLSLLNLLLGCMAVIYIMESSRLFEINNAITYEREMQPSPTDMGKLIMAGYLIFLAALIDFLDGFVARSLKAETAQGKQLDALADLVTFGVAPGFIFYKLIAESYRLDANALTASTLPFYIGLMIPLFAAVRLAAFNAKQGEATVFNGLPTPAAALFTGSLPFLAILNPWGINAYLLNAYVLIGLAVGISLLLTSPFPMLTLKFTHYRWTGNQVRYLFLGGTTLLVLLALATGIPWLALPTAIVLYVLISFVYYTILPANPETYEV